MSDDRITELEEKLGLLQKELNLLKGETEKPLQEERDPFREFKDRLEEAQKEVLLIEKEMVEAGVEAVSTTIGVSKFNGEGTGIGTSVFGSLNDLDEDRMAAALDVFTNPRRITILKLLIPEALTASEISQRTGLVGGQLYHHLTCLENAKLIEKERDRYRTVGSTQTLLCGLYAAIGGMEISRQ